jgi:hypothetical protein
MHRHAGDRESVLVNYRYLVNEIKCRKIKIKWYLSVFDGLTHLELFKADTTSPMEAGESLSLEWSQPPGWLNEGLFLIISATWHSSLCLFHAGYFRLF